jgi:hypothetical protein
MLRAEGPLCTAVDVSLDVETHGSHDVNSYSNILLLLLY